MATEDGAIHGGLTGAVNGRGGAHALQGNGHVGAVDLGGTKILAAIFAPDGTVVSRAKTMTKAGRGAAVVFDRMADAVREAAAAAGVDAAALAGIGVGAPGPIDAATGVVRVAPNLNWQDVPLRDELQQRVGVPVAVGNDVSVAVLAEFLAGAGRGVRHMVGIWPGTGVGGGLILDGKLYGGSAELAGEIGHIIIKAGGARCGCGGRGHLEAYCSRPAILREVAKAIRRGAKSELSKIAGDDVTGATSGDLAKAWRRGDKVVTKVLERTAKYLALGLASIANVLNPEMVVLGGGVVEALGDPFVERVATLAHEQPLTASTGTVRVVKSELGDDAGITGAALLARRAVAA